ncbi:MAG: helicase-related protein [Aigarchaeota archaeon]|nr:helicase-related protein [Candidatus Pelearchaeum maunauluense]
MSVRQWPVESESEPHKTYTVTLDHAGLWWCTCPAFTFRSGECKHIRKVKVEQGLEAWARFVEHPFVRPETIEERRYQRDIVERCLERNTLVVLPTALGKTVIAELVAAELLHRYPGCRILMMAPTKPLVAQHRESFVKHLRLEREETAVITGDSSRRPSQWRDSRVRVFFATPQAVWNDLARGYVPLEEFALLVFDECHRSRNRHAYTRLAGEYSRRCPWPLILALTASPGSEEDKVMEVCRNLLIEEIAWKTEEDEEVAEHIPGVQVKWVRVSLPEEYESIRRHVKAMIEERAKELQRLGLLRMPLENINRKVIVQLMARLRAEIDSGVRGENLHYMALCSTILSIYHALELVESQHVYSLRQYLREVEKSELKSHRMLARSPDFTRLVEMAERCAVDHPKMEVIAALIDQHLREKPEDRIMVFANIRHTAEILVERLREKGLRAELFIGKAEGKTGPRMSQQEQINTLNRFRRGEFNILAATAIGEEGLDIPECGYVIFYEPAVSGIRYIQRRGRTGRRLPGKVTILLTQGTVDEYYFSEGYKRARKMTRVLTQVAKRLEGIKLERRGPKPAAGEPWPWRAEEHEIEVQAVPAGETIRVEEPQREEVIEIEEPRAVESPRQKARKPGPSFRDVYHCAKDAYTIILKSSTRGVSEAELLEQLEEYQPDVVAEAVKYLEKKEAITRSGNRIMSKAAVRSSSKKAQGDIYTIEVEKILPGYAIVIVNDRFRARLDSGMYSGPRDYIKKGRVLRVRASIFRDESGSTNMLVHDVVGVIG